MQCEHLNSIIALCCYVMKYCFCGAVLYNVLKYLLMIDMECGMWNDLLYKSDIFLFDAGTHQDSAASGPKS